MKPICFLFLSVTRINPCLKQSDLEKSPQNDSLYWAYLGVEFVPALSNVHGDDPGVLVLHAQPGVHLPDVLQELL